MSCRSFPKHSQHKRGKQRRINEAKFQLQHIHDVVEVRGCICRDDRHRNSETVAIRPIHR